MYLGPAVSGILHLGLLALALTPSTPDPIVSPESGPSVEVELMTLDQYNAAISSAPEVVPLIAPSPLPVPPIDLAMALPEASPPSTEQLSAPEGVTLTPPPIDLVPEAQTAPAPSASVNAATSVPDLNLDTRALQDRSVAQSDILPNDTVRIVTAPEPPQQPRGVMEAPIIDTDPNEPPEQQVEPTVEPAPSTEVAEAELQPRNGAPPMNAPLPRPKPHGSLIAESSEDDPAASPVVDAGDGALQRNTDEGDQVVDVARDLLERAAKAEAEEAEAAEEQRILEEDARIAAEDARIEAEERAQAAKAVEEKLLAEQEAMQEEARKAAEAELAALRAAEEEEARKAAEAELAALRAAEEEEARKAAEAELAALRAAEEEEARKAAEAELAALRAAEEEEARKAAEAELAALRAAEEEKARKAAEAELAAQRAAEAEAIRRAEAEAARLAEEQRQVQAAAEALRRRAEAEEAQRQLLAQQQAAAIAEQQRRQREAEAARQYAIQQEQQRQIAIAEQQRLAAEAEAARQYALRQQQLQQYNAQSQTAQQTDRNLGVGAPLGAPPAQGDDFLAMLGTAVGQPSGGGVGSSRTFSRNVAAQNNAAPLTQGEQQQLLNQLSRCWRMMGQALPIVTMRVSFTRDGRVANYTAVDVPPGGERALEFAVRALQDTACQPFALPTQKYGSWQKIDIAFDPRNMRLQ